VEVIVISENKIEILQPKKELVESTWLLYYNNVLLLNGIITEDEYHKMINKINGRRSYIKVKH